MGNVFGHKRARFDTLNALPDDTFQLIIAACGDDVLRFEAVKGLACVSKALLQQLHRLQPLVGIRSLAAMQRPALGPWRVTLLYEGKLTGAVLDEARQGRVRSINASGFFLGPRIAKRVAELLGAGCTLLELECSRWGLTGFDWGSTLQTLKYYTIPFATWAATFGETMVCSAVLRKLDLRTCRLQGPLPELRLPALQVLVLDHNQLTGGLEPLRGCTALEELSLSGNRLTGGLDPLRGCTALRELYIGRNFVDGDLEPLRACTVLGVLECWSNLLTGGLEPLHTNTSLWWLDAADNQLTGGLEPLRTCTALYILSLSGNRFAGGLEPLRGCRVLHELYLEKNLPVLMPTDDDKAHFEKQCAKLII